MKRILAVSTFLLSTGAAFAADPIYAPISAYDWGGLWVGVSIGHVSGSVTGNTTGMPTSGPSGIDLGVHANYNMVSGNWVHGPFIEVPFGNVSGTISNFATTKVDWLVLGGYSVGYAMDRWLPYVFAGAVVGGGTESSSPSSNTHWGYTLGLGVNYGITDRWSAGLRYGFISTEKKSYAINPSTPFGWDAHRITAELNFKLY